MGQDEHGATKIPFELTRHMPLAGALHGDRQDVVARLKDGDPLWLDRELDNSHDKNAIAVYFRTDQAGYIRRSDAKMLAPLMDAGTRVAAHVIETKVYEAGSGPALGVSIALDFGAAAEGGAAEATREKTSGEKMVAAGDALSKTGGSMMACGCGLTLLVGIVALVLAFVSC